MALSAKRLRSFLSRPLGELALRVVCIDGKVFRDHCLVVALGIDIEGRKHALGLRERATEMAAVATGLLSDLVTRGPPTDRTLLFVVDGAAGLRRAISDVFGYRGMVQRCQVHKLRNVLGHLPERLHASVGKALRDAWDLDSADRAGRVLTRLAASLERDHPGAAASICEGLEETLTVQRLGLTGAVIGPDGRVTDVKVLQSVPLLDDAAIEAVRQWTYTPTLIDGVAIPSLWR